MDQDNSQEVDLNQKTEVADAPIVNTQRNLYQQNERFQSQLQGIDSQLCNMERQLLLNNNMTHHNSFDNTQMSNWLKVILSAIAVFIPGIGQIIGIIIGLVYVANDLNSDKRSFGAALITVSIIVFVLSSFFWFIFALAFGPQLYY